MKHYTALNNHKIVKKSNKTKIKQSKNNQQIYKINNNNYTIYRIQLQFRYYKIFQQNRIYGAKMYHSKYTTQLPQKSQAFTNDWNMYGSSDSRMSPGKMTFGNYSGKFNNVSHYGLDSLKEDKQNVRVRKSPYLQESHLFSHNHTMAHKKQNRDKIRSEGKAFTARQPLFKNKQFQNRHRNSKVSKITQKTTNITQFSCNEIQNLLRNQQNIIATVRQTCEHDKQKIQTDFTDFQQTLINLSNDLKLTAISMVDQQYKTFITQFKQLKSSFIAYCKLKKQFWSTKQIHSYNLDDIRFTGKQSISNQELLGVLNQDLKVCQNHVYYQQFKNIQNNVLKPILELSEVLYQQYKLESYYSTQDCYKVINNLTRRIQPQFHKTYSEIHNFMLNYSQKNKQQKKAHTSPQKLKRSISQISHNNGQSCFMQQLSNFEIRNRNNMKISEKSYVKNNDITNRVDIYGNQDRQRTTQLKKISQIKSKSNDNIENLYTKGSQLETVPCSYMTADNIKKQYDGGDTYSSTLSDNGWRQSNFKEGKNCSESRSSQMIQNNTGFSHKNKQNLQGKNESETALCMIYLKNWDKIAVGTKNGLLKIFCAKTLEKIHKSKIFGTSICSMAYIDEKYIAMGSDYGNSQIILWDVFSNANKIAAKFAHHKAAITSVIDLEDDNHFLSTGLDCQIIIYSHLKKTKKISIQSRQKITMSTLNKNKNKLITCHLSKSMHIWQIEKSSKNQPTNIHLIRQLELCAIPTCLSLHRNQIAIGFSGKLKNLNLFDIDYTMNMESYQLHEGVQDIISFDTLNQYLNVIILCLKNGQIIHYDFISKQYEVVGHGCNIVYTHGIGPKSLITVNGKLFSCNQGNVKETEIDSWQIL